ncbi:MAG: hypothetical protein KDC33_04120 [Thermoleophilia bacterium]|nr:hypothetical protein [Thermoleophilia bacterium]
MNGTLLFITILYTVVTVIGVGVYFVIIASTKKGKAEGGANAPIEKLERAEPMWAVFALVVVTVLFVATLGGVPWNNRAKADSTVDVKALQFAFVVQPATVKAGNVDFKVTSADVSHGFGLFDPDGKMVSQIQAVPGVTSTLSTKLEKAGRYKILCFEYCGVNHAQMIGQIEVTK